MTVKTDDGKTSVFKLANTYETEEGGKYYYGMLEGINCIYGFSADATVYDDVRAEDISSKNVVSLYVWDVSHMKCKAGNQVLEFRGEGTDQSDYKLTLNGESYGDNERYRQLYAFLLETKAEDLVIEEIEPTGEPLAEIQVERNDGGRSYDIQYYTAGTQKAYISVNGSRFQVIRSRKRDGLWSFLWAIQVKNAKTRAVADEQVMLFHCHTRRIV